MSRCAFAPQRETIIVAMQNDASRRGAEKREKKQKGQSNQAHFEGNDCLNGCKMRIQTEQLGIVVQGE